jgi:hypothetical protein
LFEVIKDSRPNAQNLAAHQNGFVIVDEARVLDHSSRDDPFRQIIVMRYGNYEIVAGPLPKWAKDLLPASGV